MYGALGTTIDLVGMEEEDEQNTSNQVYIQSWPWAPLNRDSIYYTPGIAFAFSLCDMSRSNVPQHRLRHAHDIAATTAYCGA